MLTSVFSSAVPLFFSIKIHLQITFPPSILYLVVRPHVGVLFPAGFSGTGGMNQECSGVALGGFFASCGLTFPRGDAAAPRPLLGGRPLVRGATSCEGGATSAGGAAT